MTRNKPARKPVFACRVVLPEFVPSPFAPVLRDADTQTRSMTPWSRFAEFEKSYDGDSWVQYCRNHAEIPVFAITLYLAFVFYVPGFLENREPWRLKKTFAAWNACLAIFSFVGATRTAPVLFHALRQKGADYTLCAHPKQWYQDGPVGLWMALFIYSKIPELGDTLFLVLQKKRVLFLGWFHHTTVLLYCWHAYHNVIATGLWFATMNYAVHAIMYSYYFFMVFRTTRPYAKTAAPCITVAQIAQMAVGSAVTFRSGFLKKNARPDCQVDPANVKLGLGMYGAYFVLFTMLFWDKYFNTRSESEKKNGKNQRKGTRAADGELVRGADKMATVCGVPLTKDGAGFFQPADANDSPEKKDNSPARGGERFREGETGLGRRKTRASVRVRKKSK